MSEKGATRHEWPRELARPGICDVCEREDVPVVGWATDDAWTSCEECFKALSQAWDEMTPAEQEETLRASR